MILPLLSAILGILAFLPYNLYPFGLIFLVPLFIFFLKENRFWRLILGTAVFRIIFSLGVVYYTLEPITWVSSIFIFIGLPISIFLLKKTLAYAFNYSPLFAEYSLAAGIPILWTLFDHLEARFSLLPAYIMTAGNSLGSSPFLGLVNFGGLIALTFFAALINIFIAHVAHVVINSRNRRSSVVVVMIAIIIIIVAWQISRYEIKNNSAAYSELSNYLKVAAISTNINFNQSDLEKVKNELKNKQIDLAVFPEDVFDSSSPNPSPDYLTWQNLAEELNINLITTLDTLGVSGKYNTTILVDKNGEIINFYDKNRLTFIGEEWPFGNWRPFFFDWILKTNPKTRNYAVFNPQTSYIKGYKKIMNLDGDISFASLICLEIHYPSDLKEYKNMGVKFIANPTSNRWLDIGISHFLYLTNNLKKMESASLKLPIISSGVKDYAGVTTPDGRTAMNDYENKNKNYVIFFGEVRY